MAHLKLHIGIQVMVWCAFLCNNGAIESAKDGATLLKPIVRSIISYYKDWATVLVAQQRAWPTSGQIVLQK